MTPCLCAAHSPWDLVLLQMGTQADGHSGGPHGAQEFVLLTSSKWVEATAPLQSFGAHSCMNSASTAHPDQGAHDQTAPLTQQCLLPALPPDTLCITQSFRKVSSLLICHILSSYSCCLPHSCILQKPCSLLSGLPASLCPGQPCHLHFQQSALLTKPQTHTL